MYVHICRYRYIWQCLNKSVPQTVTLEKEITHEYLKILAGRKAPAAAKKKKKNVNNIIFHDFRQYSVGQGACGRKKSKNINDMIFRYFQ